MVNSTVDEVLASLANASLKDDARNAVLELLRDESGVPSAAIDDGTPIFLTSVEVEGFRGIGPKSSLRLQPGAGLTLVVGPNGCGKSSFAEAVERVLTGSTRRWDSSLSDGQENWRNVHHSKPTRIRLGMRRADDHVETTTSIDWRDGDDFKGGHRSVTQPGESDAPAWATCDWRVPLDLYPPVLPYTELGAVVGGRLSELFDQFDRLLGLGVLDDASAAAGKLAKQADELGATESRLKKSATDAAQTATGLPGIDELVAGLRTEDADPDAVLALAMKLTGEGEPATDLTTYERLASVRVAAVSERLADLTALQETIAAQMQAEVARVELVADLLDIAIGFQIPGTSEKCPVCGQGTLDDSWRASAEQEVERLRAAAESFAANKKQVRVHLEFLRGAIPNIESLPSSAVVPAGAALIDLARSIRESLADGNVASNLLDRFRQLDKLVEECRTAAAAAKVEAVGRARPVVEAVAAWSDSARRAVGAADAKRNYTHAKDWLKAETQRLRQDRLAALNDQALAIWGKLRQTSSIELGPLVLEGANTRRRLELTCTTEGKPAMARSILSQGELHAIALSLFLPRATHADSPFGFILIDDPIQALDRAKVDGLAAVLAELGEHRQVVVFTHDDRLPDAVIRLGLAAHVVRVTHSAGSNVDVEYTSDQVERALNDAWTLAKDEAVEPRHALRAIAGCCRSALEAKALQQFRRSETARGRSVVEIDDQIEKAGSSLWNRISLAVFGELRPDARGAVASKFDERTAKVLSSLNAGGHEQLSMWAPDDLVRESRRAIETMFGA